MKMLNSFIKSVRKIGRSFFTNPLCLRVSLALCAMVLSFNSYAVDAGAGAGGIDKATTSIGLYKEPVQRLIYAIACVVGLVGAFNIYFKMQNGDQDVKKSIMMTIGGCIALVCLAEAIPLFFNV